MARKKGPTLRRRRQRKRLAAKLRPFGNRHKRYWKVLDRVRANPTGAHASTTTPRRGSHEAQAGHKAVAPTRMRSFADLAESSVGQRMRELAALTVRRRHERIYRRVFVAVAAVLWIVAALLFLD